MLSSSLVLFLYLSFLREIACEETEVFILSTANLERVKEVLTMLDTVAKTNQRTALNSIEKIENLYDRLKLDQSEKYQFLSMNQVKRKDFLLFPKQLLLQTQTTTSFRMRLCLEIYDSNQKPNKITILYIVYVQGNGRSVLRALQLEVDRLEEIKKENIEQFIINLRSELHGLWEQCFYSSEQINDFVPLPQHRLQRAPAGAARSRGGASEGSLRGEQGALLQGLPEAGGLEQVH